MTIEKGRLNVMDEWAGHKFTWTTGAGTRVLTQVLLRPRGRSGGRVRKLLWDATKVTWWLGPGTGIKTYDTRAQAALVVWEEHKKAEARMAPFYAKFYDPRLFSEVHICDECNFRRPDHAPGCTYVE
jgi:hypothetical protein